MRAVPGRILCLDRGRARRRGCGLCEGAGDGSKIPYVKIPTDTLKLIAKHQSGICLEYIVQSPIHANTLLANSWECKGHKLTKAQKQQIAQELKEATQHQNPYIILVYYLNKFINKYS